MITGSEPSWTAPFTGRPWSLPLEDRVLLVAAYRRTNLTLRRLAPLFALVDCTVVPTRDHTVAERSENHRCSMGHQVVVDADTRLLVAAGRPRPGNRNDCEAWAESGAKDAVGTTMTIADGGHPSTGPALPHRHAKGQAEPLGWKILRGCRLEADGVHRAMLGIARPHNLALTG